MKKIKLFLAAMAAMVGLSAQAWDGSEGTVYLQNVGSGLYWGAGDHLNWGTRAMLVANPESVTLHLADGVYKLESQVSNGGTAYYFNGDYMDNASPVSLTITESGDYWTIVKSDNSETYGYDGSSTVLGKAVDTTTDNGKWIIRTHEEMLSDLANGTIAAPKDATFLFLDPGFGRNNRNVGSWSISNDCTNKNLDGANPNNYGCGESYHSKFTISQTAIVPNGVYKVSGRAFYRQDGTDNTHIPYLEANGQKSPFPLMNTGINSMKGAQESFMAGNWAIDPMIVEVTTGSLTIKMVCEQTSLWCILDGFELEYYGEITLADLPLDEAYVTSYNNALNAAKAYQSQDMFDADKTALNSVISANTFDASTKTQGELDDVLAAIDALNTASDNAAAAVAKYTQYNTAVTTIDGGSNVDLTAIIRNPNFEDNSPVAYRLVDGGWLNEGVGVQYQNNSGFDDYKDGNFFAERWVASGQIGAFKTYQELTLPAGIYELSVVANFNGEGATLFVGDATTPITDASTYKLLFQTNDKETVSIGLQAVNPSGSWFKADNFQLTYVGDDFPAYTLIDGKMSSVAAAAQSNAETAFTSNKTVANYNTLFAAIASAQASKDAYAAAKVAIDDANTLKEAHNFVTADAATTFADAIAAIETPYNEGTLLDTDANAAGTTLGVSAVGWHGVRAEADYTPAESYMKSAGFNAEFNDWSVEGVTDGSNFLIPFFQNWIADGNSLAKTTITGSLTDLPNGLYTVQAWVRVRAKNETAATDATGITMDVNGGGEGDYAAVDVTEGTQVGETQFTIGTFTAQGLVKQGTLTLNFNVADDTNISWLSFKNINYTKVRDLTEEEAFVAATAEDYAALNTAIAAHTLGFEAGEYAPYNNVAGAAAVAAANAIDQTAENSQEDVQAATAAITGATWTANAAEVNAIWDGSFAYDYRSTTPSGNINPYGWQRVKDAAADGYNVRYQDTSDTGLAATSTGKALFTKQSAYYGYADGYTMPLKANTYYKVTFIYGGWGDCKKDGYVSMAAPDGSSVTLSATDLPVDATDANTNVASWKNYEAIFQTGVAGNYVLGLRKKSYDTSGQSQYAYGDIVLVKATAADFKPELLAKITTANAVDVTTNVGDDVFQIPTSAATALTTAISDAQAVYDNADATIDDVLAATESVPTAVETYNNVELNAPDAEKIYALTIVDESKAWNGNAVTFIAGARNDQGGYGIKYLAPTNVNLAQGLKLTKTTGNNYKISVTKADGTQQYLTTAKLGHNTGNNQQIRTTDDVEKALEVEIRLNGDGQFLLWNTAQNAAIANNDNNDMYTSRTANFTIAETTKPSIAINTTAAGWGTVILPFAVASLPEGVKAYSCAETAGKNLTLVEVTALEANKPYIIEGAWNEKLTGDAQGTALTYTDGLLTGVYAKQSAPAGSYVLLKKNDKVAFYRVEADKEPDVTANHAYLTVSNPESVKAFFFPDTTTAIQGVFSEMANGNIYDLQGRKVQKMQKGGIYVINGQKVTVK